MKFIPTEEMEGSGSPATYQQEIEAIEAILAKANVLLREFDGREKNHQIFVCEFLVILQ